jgi:hypothetical protein
MTQWRLLRPDERADPTCAATNNDGWWVNFFKMCRDKELLNTDGLIWPLTSWNKDMGACFWGMSGCTLSAVLNGFRNGAPMLEMRNHPSGTMKEEHTDPHSKQDVMVDNDNNFFQYYGRSGRRMHC